MIVYFIKHICVILLLFNTLSCETKLNKKVSLTTISPKIEQKISHKHANKVKKLSNDKRNSTIKIQQDKKANQVLVKKKDKITKQNQQIKNQNFELRHITNIKNKSFRGVRVVSINDENKWEEIHFYDKTYAVIIGIDNYQFLPSDQHLSYAVSDAKAVERLLRNKYLFNKIYTLYDEQATKNKILGLLLNKLSKVSKNDAVFVFFAGHGGQEKTDFGDIGFILPYDGKFEDMRTVISMTAIRDDISKRIKAKHVFYVMDSCYSGILVSKRSPVTENTRRNIEYLKQIAREPVRQVLTAGSANQKVLDGGPGGHSVFTGRLLEVFNEANDYITANEISSIIKEKVYSDANARGHTQTPKSGELFGLGDFIFMPSITKKLGNIKDQISDLENELITIKNAESTAIQHQNRVAQRKAERERKVAEAKLIAKQLEEKRLKEEELLRIQRKQEYMDLLSKQKQQKKDEEERLAKLQHEVELKRKHYKNSMLTSIDEALREMQTLDKEIKDIRTKFIDDLKKRIINIAKLYSDNYKYKSSSLVKDEFETEAEYQARLSKSMGNFKSTNKSEFASAMELLETAYLKQITPLYQQLNDISNKEYTVYGHDALTIKLGKYNADKEIFKITIASKNITRPIYPQGRFLFVSESSGQARKVGIKTGDIFIKYNNIMITPNVNWKRLKQTVISDNVIMEIDRNGKLLQFNLKKGQIGINTYVDDYLKDLKPDQFVIHGDLHVSRAEARRFKQNYLNNFITAEVNVRSISNELCLSTKAIIIDESNDKKYDLFESPHLSLGNRLIYNSNQTKIWFTHYPKKLNWNGANIFINKSKYKGIRSWKMPSFQQFQTLRSASDYSYFNFLDKWFWTSTPSGRKNNHWQYSPRNNDRDNDYDTDSIYFAMTYSLKDKINKINRSNLLLERFIKIDNALIFDTELKIIWFSGSISNKKYTWIEADKLIKQFNSQGFKGWRMPTYDEISSLYDYSIPGIDKLFNFSDKWFWTSTPSGRKNNHWQYCPSGKDRDNDYDTDKIYIIGVM